MYNQIVCPFTLAEYIDYTQPVYVWREDPNSRQNTIQEIKERASSEEEWPQVRKATSLRFIYKNDKSNCSGLGNAFSGLY